MFPQSHQEKQILWDISSLSIIAPSTFSAISRLSLNKVLWGDTQKKMQPGQACDDLV